MVSDLGLGVAAAGLVGCALGAAYAEAHIISAAIGVLAEKPELFGRVLLMSVLPETILVFGFVFAAIIMFVM